jgi:hypothetical protein
MKNDPSKKSYTFKDFGTFFTLNNALFDMLLNKKELKEYFLHHKITELREKHAVAQRLQSGMWAAIKSNLTFQVTPIYKNITGLFTNSYNYTAYAWQKRQLGKELVRSEYKMTNTMFAINALVKVTGISAILGGVSNSIYYNNKTGINDHLNRLGSGFQILEGIAVLTGRLVLGGVFGVFSDAPKATAAYREGDYQNTAHYSFLGLANAISAGLGLMPKESLHKLITPTRYTIISALGFAILTKVGPAFGSQFTEKKKIDDK